MAVQVKDIRDSIDLRTIERAILYEAAGCDSENEKVKVFQYSYGGVILHLGALTKKLLGIYGVAIGNDPRRAAMVGASYRDWDAERARIDRADNPWREQQLAELENDKRRADSIDAAFDADAWRIYLEVEDIVKRRAMALDRLGLVTYAPDDQLPTEVMQAEVALKGTGKIPNENCVEITREGYRFLASGKKLQPKKDQRPCPRFDEDLEIVDG